MRFLRAKYSIVTPMFLGDARQDCGGIRPASVKGALAFWWRAMKFGWLVKPNVSTNDALAELRKQEIALFGGQKTQSGFSLRIKNEITAGTAARGDTLRDRNAEIGHGSRYLGYGLMGAFGEKAGKLERSCILSGSFTLEILFHPRTTAPQRDEIADAMKLLGLLGGLGARSRRGYGSLHLEELCDDERTLFTAPGDRDAYIEAIKGVVRLPTQTGGNFLLSAFAKDSRIHVGTVLHDTALRAHDAIGSALQRYRAWRLPMGAPEQNFAGDHHWYRKCGTATEPAKRPPERIAFGLPQNYYSQGTPPESVTPDGQLDRRASPLMFHLQQIGDQYLGVATYLPTRFLPENEVNARGRVNYDFAVQGRPVIEGFLDGARGKNPPYLTGGNIL